MNGFQYYRDKYTANEKKPENDYIYYAYSKGTVTECSSHREAYQISSNIEKVDKNKDLIAQYRKRKNQAEQLALQEWLKDLRNEYPDLSDEVFDKVYSFAYEISHPDGHDAIAITFDEIAEVVIFAVQRRGEA